MHNNNDLAAYTLNLCNVSISQIVDYDDVNILKQEYDTILNNLNLEKIIKDQAVLELLSEILDEITNLLIDEGDRKMVDMEYQHKMKNAIWNAVPNIGAVFATSDPIAMGVTLATQIGIGYMNYRRTRAEGTLEREKSKWNIQRNRMQHLSGLQQKLFQTAWTLADTYNFPDEYRLTDKQIKEYNKVLMEPNPFRRFKNLYSMKAFFTAYPPYWYQTGSIANSIFLNKENGLNPEDRNRYKLFAVECFERYHELNKISVLRSNPLTSAWALEYLELLDLNAENDPQKAAELIEIAEKSSDNAFDILELCAFAYIRIRDNYNAARVLNILVNNGYNISVNAQLLSGLYIYLMGNHDTAVAKEAEFEYNQLPHILREEDRKFILSRPADISNLSDWEPVWDKSETFDEFVDKQNQIERENQKRIGEKKNKARPFYQRSIVLVYKSKSEAISGALLSILNKYRESFGDSSLPYPVQCELKQYKEKRMEYERSGAHVIFIGDSHEAEQIYKNGNKHEWDYSHLGMYYRTSGNNTVLLAKPLKNKQLNEFIAYVKELNELYDNDFNVPGNVKKVELTFMKEMFDTIRPVDFHDAVDVAATTITTTLFAPVLVLGQICEINKNFVQDVINHSAKNKIEKLQYMINIYKYLDSESAIME